MQFIDLKTQFERIEEDVCKRVDAVLHGQKYIMGPEIVELEEKLAAYVGVKHAFTCSSGTDALVIPLMAFGLQKNDAVFVPSFTFFASGESVTLAGGTPVFVDSDAMTYNVSPDDLERAIESTIEKGELVPKGIIAVDLFGQLADYAAIQRIADKYQLFVLEDAAQGFGATRGGKRAGSFGTVAATSFFPAKPLGCYGDGGAIFTDDDELADLIRSIRVHGQGTDKYDNIRIGVNGRMDTMQAAVLLAKMQVFDDEIVARNEAARAYTERLRDILTVPYVVEGDTSVWAQYTLQAKDSEERQKIMDGLNDRGIPTACYYPVPMHLSSAYAFLGYKKGDLPICEQAAERVFSIPMHPYLELGQIDEIANALKEVLA